MDLESIIQSELSQKKTPKYHILTDIRGPLCDPTNYSSPASSVHPDSPGKNPGVGSRSLLQGIFLIQERAQVPCIAGGFFTVGATRGAPEWPSGTHQRGRNRSTDAENEHEKVAGAGATGVG